MELNTISLDFLLPFASKPAPNFGGKRRERKIKARELRASSNRPPPFDITPNFYYISLSLNIPI
jgi:hypothetical protein